MKKYTVLVDCIVTKKIVVKAATLSEALDKATDMAASSAFDSYDAELANTDPKYKLIMRDADFAAFVEDTFEKHLESISKTNDCINQMHACFGTSANAVTAYYEMKEGKK